MDLPVRLLFAQSIMTGRGPGGNSDICYWVVEAYVELENIAYQKDVRFRWWGEDIDQQDTPAVYVRSLKGHREIWRAVSPTKRYWIHQGGPSSIAFAVSYQVSDRSYWDNNCGRDYRVSFAYLPRKCSLGALGALLIDASVADNHFTGELVVKNLSGMKKVQVFYSTDKWANVQSTTGSRRSGGEEEQEIWEFCAQLESPGDIVVDEVHFAVWYQAGGHSYWDNNAGHNYSIRPPGSIATGTLTLEDILSRLAANEG